MQSIKQISSPNSGVFGTGFGKVAAAAIMSVFFLLTANAAQAQLVITHVIENQPDGQITINGMNFDNGQTPEVTLGDDPTLLAIDIPFAADQIVATLPGGLPAGDYLLTVRTGNGNARTDIFYVTVGGASGLPSGAIILWDNDDACPTDFTRVADADDRVLMGSDLSGVDGGNAIHNHGAGNFSAGAHSHRLLSHAKNPPGIPEVDDNSGGENFSTQTDSSGGGNVGGQSGNADHTPPFRTFLVCRAN